MNWLKRKIVKWVREDWDSAGRQVEMSRDIKVGLSLAGAKTLGAISNTNVDSNPTLQFKVWNAVGGRVVEFARYDDRHERTHHSVYIIAEDQEFGSRIAKIATMEALKG
jgi:hypothetical protein